MSERVASPEVFVPLEPPSTATAGKAAAAPAHLKVLAKAEDPPAFTPLSFSAATHAHAATSAGAKPVVTLQRDGDRVTSIRVECGCGQVIELACSY
jgi:hypothetical protein